MVGEGCWHHWHALAKTGESCWHHETLQPQRQGAGAVGDDDRDLQGAALVHRRDAEGGLYHSRAAEETGPWTLS